MDRLRGLSAGPFRAVVADYIRRIRPRARAEIGAFRSVPLEEAVQRAGLALWPDGKRFRHQFRIPGPTLARAARILESITPVLRRCTTFDDLHALITERTKPIKGLGELYRYDTALRIGAALGLEPVAVYLHRGTREGARSLGFDERRQTIEPQEFPRPFQPPA
jgi:hypothetical protein